MCDMLWMARIIVLSDRWRIFCTCDQKLYQWCYSIINFDHLVRRYCKFSLEKVLSFCRRESFVCEVDRFITKLSLSKILRGVVYNNKHLFLKVQNTNSLRELQELNKLLKLMTACWVSAITGAALLMPSHSPRKR